MKRFTVRAAVVLSSFSLSCASTPPPAAAPAESNRSAEPAPAPLLSMVSKDANFVAVLDGQALAEDVVAPLLETLTTLSPELAGMVDDTKRKCGFEPWTAARQIVAFGSVLSSPKAEGNSDHGVFALETTVPPVKMLDCLAHLGTNAPQEKGGWTRVGDLWGQANERFVLLASSPSLGDGAIERLGAGDSPSPLTQSLERGTVAAVFSGASHVPLRRAQLLGGPADDPSRLGLSLVFRSEEKAEDTEREFMGVMATLEAGAGSEQTPAQMQAWSRRLLQSLRVKRVGAQLDVEVQLPKAEPETLASLAAIATTAVRRYISRAKSSEARLNVAQIGKRLLAWCADHPVPKQGCRLRSAPRVPAKVPLGQKHVSSPEDWSHPMWQELTFAPRGAVYYSYEIEAAADGRSATVRAIGDLDGDGVESRFELGVRVLQEGGKSVVRLDEEITETKWDE